MRMQKRLKYSFNSHVLRIFSFVYKFWAPMIWNLSCGQNDGQFMEWDITTGPAVAKCRETSPSIGQRDITRPREWEKQRTEVKVNEKEGMEEEMTGPQHREMDNSWTPQWCPIASVWCNRALSDTHTHTLIDKLASGVTCTIPHSSR